MPKYLFTCDKCNKTTHKYVPVSVEEQACDICSSVMKREMPRIDSPSEVREVIDPYTNKTWVQDQAEVLKQRKDQHFWDVEVPRLVETMSIETCLENGWLTYNEKGELVIGKAPSKR